MLAIQTTAPRTRKRAAPAHVVVCLCGQRYDRFRADIGMTAGEATSALISAAGRDLLTDAERAAIHAARWRLMVAARATRKAG